MSPHRVCVAMSFDSKMFAQAQQCMATLREHAPEPLEVCAVAMNLSPDEVAWLKENHVTVFTDLARIPTYKDAPSYAYAHTCRPMLPELFPGYEIYLWVDADIRFAHRDAFDFYLQGAAAAKESVAICQEVDPTYEFVRNPKVASTYHRTKYQRLEEVYGPDVGNQLAFSISYNAGIFAMHRESKLWPLYFQNLQRAVAMPFNDIKEQDAMNVAIAQSGVRVRNAPTIMNWLCALSPPTFDRQNKRWVRPEYPHTPISVLHLTNSNTKATPEGLTYYDIYKQVGLTL